ncbi:DedA family protein/thiosulfate sulfurtransferase GlpE [Caldimonas sp. KR1-144]|uniref:DedA family protein/thiosulfate sulfurtransferase GlpE n=1 Tax=Caldimonas sp. KR1-144 TaxID=3400911 RepID=UPI003BFC1913
MQDLIDLVVRHGIAIVFGATLAARVGLPVPASPLLVVAGGLAVAGALSLPAALAASIVANVLGDGVWYLAGRRFGHRVMGLLCRLSMSPDSCVRQSESLIVRWGGSSLVAAKFVPGVSVVAAPMAGAVRMPLVRFIGYDIVAGAIWSAAFLGLGAAFSDQIQELLVVMSNAGTAAGTVLVLLLAAFVGWRWWRRRRFLRQVAMSRISADELHALMERGEAPVILDVRAAGMSDLDPRRIPGALRVDFREVRRHAATLPRDRDIVLYCNCPNEASAASAAAVLAAAGLTRVRPLAGGLDGWASAGRPIDEA